MEKQYNLGILSTAGVANKFYPAFQECENINLVGVASRSIEKAQKWADEHGDIKAYGSYENLLEDQSIECVYIPLPTGLKYEWTKKALESDKHVLVEKPLVGVTDTKELQELIALAKQKNKQILECTTWIHSTRTKILEEKIFKDKEIGEISKVISGITFRSDENFQANNIRSIKSLEPLGAVGDVVWYSTMAALWTFNFEVPERIQSINFTKNKEGVYTLLTGVLYFSNNRIAFVDGSFTESRRQNFEIVGTQGSYRIDDFVGGQNQKGKDPVVLQQRKGFGTYKYLDQSGKAEIREVEKSDAALHLVKEFVQRIQQNDQSQYWLKRSLLCQQSIVQFHLSAEQNGKILEFDSKL